MTRLALERHQVWLYLAAIALGLAAGTALPSVAPALEHLLWPTLALLLFATFLQVPLRHLREALSDRRFAAAVLLGNFVAVPLLAWGLASLLLPAGEPALRLGVLLVLLVPCTDWFITFSQLGGGNVPRAVAVTPLNLVLQLLLLPLYLALMTDTGGLGAWEPAGLVPATLIVLVPLAAAAVAERGIATHPRAQAAREAMAWWPVPLLAVVVFLIAAAQVGAVRAALAELATVLPVFVLYLAGAALLARGLAGALKLPRDQGRTLAFSLGTRNSFVVLPLALALPAGWEVAAMVVVAQSLVELFGMVVYVWAVPKVLFR
ncbi:bile acid:sodium symporter [Hydrogenophaga sp.]|uniref:bile acid:sodium symporter n=1 Tax=Hydrogenophaga sp. TaxID=1904254 RepID=UPI0026321BCE|nr:bile acid:sodium symporter [Hydrogenophaga sp.]MCW5654817.1 bile acid:sodium symporter [Hydrogenophaga sp.]